MNSDHSSIIKDLKKGDHKAFNDLFDCYYHPMCSFISSIIPGKDVVEDIVTDCFVKIWEERKSLEIHCSVRNYLLTLAKNSAISHLRKNKIHHIEIEKAAKIIFEEDPPLMREADVYNKLYQAVSKLPEQRQKILRMATFDKKSYADIAKELNISINTVKTQMARSYRFLKSELNYSYRTLLNLLYLYFVRSAQI
jgi:RNA polymerase sigma-70 factor (ECF subfamily)